MQNKDLSKLSREELQRLLEQTYELEGLILLALNRDPRPEGLDEMILNKVSGVGVQESDFKDIKDLKAPKDPTGFDSYDLDDEPEVPATEAAAPAAPAPAPAASPVSPVVPAPASKAAPIFSVNDRFLFNRELFGGKMADFEEALTLVASMDSYEEAEEYFISERGFNPELPIVQDFLTIISNCFA